MKTVMGKWREEYYTLLSRVQCYTVLTSSSPFQHYRKGIRRESACTRSQGQQVASLQHVPSTPSFPHLWDIPEGRVVVHLAEHNCLGKNLQTDSTFPVNRLCVVR